MKIPSVNRIDADPLFLSRLNGAELVRFIGEAANATVPVVRQAENGEYAILKIISDHQGDMLEIRKYIPPPPPYDVIPSWSLIFGNIFSAFGDIRRRLLGR